MAPEELREDLAEIKREVIEARNLTIKTDNNMRTVHAEMKKVSANQQAAEKRARLSSIGAYVLFVVIIGAMAVMLSNVKASSLSDKIDGLEKTIVTLNQEKSTLAQDIQARDAAEKRAVSLLKLIRDENKENAVAEFRKIKDAELSQVELALLKERIDAFAAELAGQHYDKGVAQWRIGGYKSAIQELETSLDYKSDSENRSMLLYFLGLSELQLKRVDKGIEHLKASISDKLGKDLSDRSRLKIADTYIENKRWNDALDYLTGLPDAELGYWTRLAVQNKIKWVKQQQDAEKAKQAQE